MNPTINIAIADDEELFRKGVTFLLERESNFNLLFEAENGQDLIDKLKSCKQQPDIILMDLKMPKLNGVEATKIIHEKHPEICIIALTSYGGKTFITNMIDVGASSYLLKNSSPKVMVNTINEVFRKGFYYDETVMKIIDDKSVSYNGESIKMNLDKELLSCREIDVLDLICKQYTTGEIAEKLFISPRTVDGHRNKLLIKTQSKNIAGLVIYCIQNKLVQISDDEII